jgi:hypothetical protein
VTSARRAQAAILAAAGAAALVLSAQTGARSPTPLGAIASAGQLAWHDLQFYRFIHFTVKTFTDREWSYGDKAESVFNPTQFDVRQWAQVACDSGMKGAGCRLAAPREGGGPSPPRARGCPRSPTSSPSRTVRRRGRYRSTAARGRRVESVVPAAR